MKAGKSLGLLKDSIYISVCPTVFLFYTVVYKCGGLKSMIQIVQYVSVKYFAQCCVITPPGSYRQGQPRQLSVVQILLSHSPYQRVRHPARKL